MRARQVAVREVSVRVRPGGRAGVAQMSCVLLSTFMYPRQGLACNRLSCPQLFFQGTMQMDADWSCHMDLESLVKH